MVWIRGEFGQPRAFCAGVLLLLSVLCAGVSSIRIDGIEPDAGPMSGVTKVMVRVSPIGAKDDMFKRHPYPRCKFGANDMVVNATYVKCTLKPRKVGSMEALTKVKNETCIQCDDAPPSQNNEIVPLTVSVTGDFRDSENNFGYRYYKDPVIWAIYPSYGPKNGQTYVQVWGENFLNFDQNLRCGFGTKEVPAYFMNEGYMYCYSPQSDVVLKRMPFSVTLNNQQNTPQDIPYWYYPSVSISKLIPNRGPDEGGTRVLLKGHHFHPFVDKLEQVDNRNDTFCRFGELGLVKTEVINATKSICYSPPSYILRWVYVEITLNNQQYTDDMEIFYYYHPPMVYEINPRRGPVKGNTTVVVTGSHFTNTGDIRCKFNETVVKGKYVDTNTIECVSPPYPQPETVPLAVALEGDKYSSGINTMYTYYDTPVVGKIDPICGPERGYTQITITGENFLQDYNIAVCLFNGTRAMNATVMSNSTLVCDSPPVIDEYGYNSENVEFYYVSVQFSGAAPSGHKLRFDYYPEVEITNVVPHGGPIEGGNVVRFEGSGFAHKAGCNRHMHFGPIEVKPLNFTDKAMWVKAPNVTVPDDVVVAIGLNGQQYNHDKKINVKEIENTYTYYSRPVITHYMPKIGHAKGGTVQTVYGRGFTPFRDEAGKVRKDPMNVRFLQFVAKNKKPTKLIGEQAKSFEIEDDYFKWSVPPAKAGTKAILEVSMNGQEWTKVIPEGQDYSYLYYDSAHVNKLEPSYGPVRSPKDLYTIVNGQGFTCPDGDCSQITAQWTDTDQDNAKIKTKCQYISETQLNCTVPKYNTPNVLKVDVSMDGEDFTTDNLEYGFFDPYILSVEPKLVSTKGGTTLSIKGYGFVNVSSDRIRVRYGTRERPLVCGATHSPCVVNARYINKNEIQCETLPQRDMNYDSDKSNVNFDEFAVEVSLFEAEYTHNNITIMYYDESVVTSIEPNWAPSNDATPLIAKTQMKWKPDGPNDPATFRKYANFTCRFTSSTGQKVTTQGRMMVYPYPGKNCSITVNGTTTQKECSKLENAVFCPSPSNWTLPEGVEKEDIALQIAINGKDYSPPMPFTIVEGLEILRVVPRCGPREGSAVRVLGKGFSPNLAQSSELRIRWGVLTTKLMKKQSVIYYLYKKQASGTQSEKITHSQLVQLNDWESELNDGQKYKLYPTAAPTVPKFQKTHGGPIYVSLGKSQPLKWQNSTEFDIHVYSKSFMEYFYYIQPTVKYMWPTGGTVNGGSLIVMEGQWFKFRPEYGVVPYCRFGQKIVRGRWLNTVRVLCPSPSTDQGNSKVTVSVSQNAVAWADSPTPFSYFETPVIDSMEPQSGPANGGTLVKLRGSKFSPHFDQGHFFCRFTPLEMKMPPKQILAQYKSDKEVVCPTPGGWGSGNMARVDITYNSIQYFPAPGKFYFFNIIRAFPRSGPADGTGGFIHIQGQGFREEDPILCRIGENDDDLYRPVSVTFDEIKCPMPKSKNGPKFFGNVRLEVTINSIDYHVFNGGFQYYEQPTIKSINPITGPATGNGIINFYGDNFRDDFPLAELGCRIGPAVGKAKVLNEHHMQCTVQDIPLARQNMTHNAAIALNNYSFTKPHSRTLFVAYGIRYIEPNAGPINAKTPIIIHGAGFFETKEAKCRFGVPGNYAIVKATVLSSEKMLCRAPGKFKFGKGFQLPVGVPFSIALNQEKYNPWTESFHTYVFYTQPRVKKVIPNFAKVGEVKEVFVYAWEGTEFIEPPPTSEMPSKYGPTCKFGRFGKTPAVLINATLAKCLTPAITENPNKIYRDTQKFQLALNGEDFTQKDDRVTFTFIGTGSYPYWWYILLFLLIALLLFLLVLCIQLCWRFRPRLEMPQVREDVRNKGPHVIRDHMGMVRPRGLPEQGVPQGTFAGRPSARPSVRPSNNRPLGGSVNPRSGGTFLGF